jgi:hypothetical protein
LRSNVGTGSAKHTQNCALADAVSTGEHSGGQTRLVVGDYLLKDCVGHALSDSMNSRRPCLFGSFGLLRQRDNSSHPLEKLGVFRVAPQDLRNFTCSSSSRTHTSDSWPIMRRGSQHLLTATRASYGIVDTDS